MIRTIDAAKYLVSKNYIKMEVIKIGKDKEYKRIYVDGESTEYFVSKTGDVISKYKGKTKHLKVFKTEKGYKYVKLWINGKSVARFIHRLVAEAYIPNPENKPEVNHKDGKKYHCYVTNLEWVTSKENKAHAKRKGLAKYAYGDRMGCAKNTNAQIEECCKLLSENKKNIKEISKITGVSTDTIYAIRSKGKWAHIAKKYKMPELGYTKKQIKKVCKLLEENKLSQVEISKETKVSTSMISNILHGKLWGDVSKKYDFSKRLKRK